MQLSTQQIVPKLISFFLHIALELWILFEAYRLYTNSGVAKYSVEGLFWLFLLVMIAPVLPQITFYTKNKVGALVFHGLVALIVLFLIILEPSFIPTMPIIEVIFITLYAYVTTGVNYLNYKENLEEQTKTEIAYTSFKIIAFFIAVYAGIYFGNQDSFSANYLLYILISTPLFILFAISIFINFELRSSSK